MSEAVSAWEIVLRLVVAVAGSAVVGWEREAKDRPAGLRTHVLVGLGACAFTLVGLELTEELSARSDRAQLDPLRTVAGIIGGVGFLGAGTILHSHGRIRGLTTAAGVWVVAAIGIASAIGSYLLAALTTLAVFATLAALKHLEEIGPSDDADGGDAERDRSPPER